MSTMNANLAYYNTLASCIYNSVKTSPRGLPSVEVPCALTIVDTRYPVITMPARKLSYPFMAAEAYWILSGDRSVAGIAHYCKAISAFSDDGVIFNGAYGPPIQEQMPYIIRTLLRDKDSRQACLTIWERNPGPSKDIPCTIALWFTIRNEKLNCVAMMRSSDIWLGLPYDIFNFSMITHHVVSLLRDRADIVHQNLQPGLLYIFAASSHIYEKNRDQANTIVKNPVYTHYDPTPSDLYETAGLMTFLRQLRDTKPGDPLRWWENILIDGQPSLESKPYRGE